MKIYWDDIQPCRTPLFGINQIKKVSSINCIVGPTVFHNCFTVVMSQCNKEGFKKDGACPPSCNGFGGILRRFGGAAYRLLCNS